MTGEPEVGGLALRMPFPAAVWFGGRHAVRLARSPLTALSNSKVPAPKDLIYDASVKRVEAMLFPDGEKRDKKDEALKLVVASAVKNTNVW